MEETAIHRETFCRIRPILINDPIEQFFAHVARMFWHQHNREPTGFESRLMVARWSLLEKSHSIEDIKAQDQWQHPSKYPKPIDTAMVIDALKSINADSVAFEAVSTDIDLHHYSKLMLRAKFARLVCTKLTSRDQQRLKGLTNILEKKYLSEYKAAHEYKRQGIVTDTVSEIRDLLRKMGAPPAAPVSVSRKPLLTSVLLKACLFRPLSAG